MFRAALAGVLFAAALLASLPAQAQQPSPYAIDIPSWFVGSFLDFPEEVAEAARADKRVLLYFGQDGCPYCKKLMEVNFRQPDIVKLTRARFAPIAINIWGDLEVTWIDGRKMPEKEFARALNVQFTPTLLVLDEHGVVIARMNGYYPPRRFKAALDFGAQHLEHQTSLSDYLDQHAPERRSGAIPKRESFFMRPPYDLQTRKSGKPLVVFFESADCGACEELHRDGLPRPEIRKLLKDFDAVRLNISDPEKLVAPGGAPMSASAWAHGLNIAYLPALVFFDQQGKEVFRAEAYLRPFHLASALEYIASGAYKNEASFQRFVQTRADRLRRSGVQVDLMN